MSETGTAALPTLLVLTSTYPRWVGDPEPGFVHELAKRLTAQFRVIVLGPHAPGALPTEMLDGVKVIRYRYAPQRWEILVNDGGIVTNLQRNGWKLLLVPGFVIAQAWVAWRIARVEKVNVIHAHWLIPQGLIAALLRRLPGCRVPFVVTSHGADLFALKGAFMQRLKRFVIRSACAVTVVSETMRRRVNEIDPGTSDAIVQPMGVDLQNRFMPDPSCPRSANDVLFVGRLVEKKGVRHLLDAMPAVLARWPAANLLIVGFGPEESVLRRRVVELGLDTQVRFLGAVSQPDLPNLYQRAALFVAPFVEAGTGDQEGLGLVLVEAMGCGCPVVAGDVPAVRDAFRNASHRLVDPRRSDALAASILSVLECPQHAREEVAGLRESLIGRFDWQSVADKYAVLLWSCADRVGRKRITVDSKVDTGR